MKKWIFLSIVLLLTLNVASAEQYNYCAKDNEIYNIQIEEKVAEYNKMYDDGKDVSIDSKSSFKMKAVDVSEAFYYKNIDEYLIIGHKEGKSIYEMASKDQYILFPARNEANYVMSIIYRYDDKNQTYKLDTTSVSVDPEARYTLCASNINRYIEKINDEIEKVDIYYSTLYYMYIVNVVGKKNNYIVPVYYLTKEARTIDWFPFESGSILTEEMFFEKMDEYYDEEYTLELGKSSEEELFGAGIYHRSDVESLGLRNQLQKGKTTSAAESLNLLNNLHAKSVDDKKKSYFKIIIYAMMAVIIVVGEGVFLYKTKKKK